MTGFCIPKKSENTREANDKWKCQKTFQSKSNESIVPSLVQEFERLIKASRKPITGFCIPKKFESTREANDKWRYQNTGHSIPIQIIWLYRYLSRSLNA